MLNPYIEETAALCRAKGWDQSSVETVWLLFSEEVS